MGGKIENREVCSPAAVNPGMGYLLFCFSVFLLLVIPFGACADGPVSHTIRHTDSKRNHAYRTAYEITGIEESQAIGEGLFHMVPEGKFVVVKFTVRNKSKQPVPSNVISGITLKDKENRPWLQSVRATGMMRLGTESFGRTTLKAGKTMKDVVVFDVPGDIGHYSVCLPGGKRLSAQRSQKNQPTPETSAVQKKKEAVRHEVVKKETEKAAKASFEKLAKKEAFHTAMECASYEEEIRRTQPKKDMTAEGKLHYDASGCYLKVSNYAAAARHIDDAAAISRTINSPEIETLSLIGKSRLQLALGDKANALELFLRASDKAEKDIFQNLWVHNYYKALVSFQMALFLLDIGERDKANVRLSYAMMLDSDLKLKEGLQLERFKQKGPADQIPLP